MINNPRVFYDIPVFASNISWRAITYYKWNEEIGNGIWKVKLWILRFWSPFSSKNEYMNKYKIIEVFVRQWKLEYNNIW